MDFDLLFGSHWESGWLSSLHAECGFGIALFVAACAAADYYSFLRGWWLISRFLLWPSAPTFCFVSLYRSLFEEKKNGRVRSAFGQYLSPEVIRRLLVNRNLSNRKKPTLP